MEAVGGTWAQLDWVQPSYVGLQGISYYTVTVVDLSGVRGARNVSTPDNATTLNVTDLFPATDYSFKVRAVSSALGVEVRGQASDAYNGTTQVTGKNLFVDLQLILI